MIDPLGQELTGLVLVVLALIAWVLMPAVLDWPNLNAGITCRFRRAAGQTAILLAAAVLAALVHHGISDKGFLTAPQRVESMRHKVDAMHSPPASAPAEMGGQAHD